MKKIIIVLNLLALALFISGCGCSKKEKETECTYSAEIEDYNLIAIYNIKHYPKNGTVTKVTEKISVSSSNISTLESLKQINDIQNSVYSQFEQFSYESAIDDDKLNINIDIDYSQIDINKFVMIDNDNQKLVLDGKINYDKYINYYETSGFKCKKK